MKTNTKIDTSESESEYVAIKIACEFHGRDPYHMTPEEKLQAIENATIDRETFISTLIALLPLQQRRAASYAWDRLN